MSLEDRGTVSGVCRDQEAVCAVYNSFMSIEICFSETQVIDRGQSGESGDEPPLGCGKPELGIWNRAMRSSSFDVVRAAMLSPTFEVLEKSGVSVNRLLNSNGFRAFQFRDPCATVPYPLVSELWDRILRSEGVEVIEVISRAYSKDRIPGWGAAILSHPTVLAALKAGASPSRRTFSSWRAGLELRAADAVYTSRINLNSRDRVWEAAIAIRLTLDTFRAGGQEDWMPTQIDVPLNVPSMIDGLFDFEAVDVRFGQDAMRFYFDPIILGEKLRNKREQDSSSFGVSDLISTKIFDLLQSLKPDCRPSIEVIAEAFGVSPRTIERRLEQENTTFRGVLKTWRTGRALELLQNSRLSIEEISTILHYSTASHFHRAFRSWTSMTPGQYRDAM